MIAIVPAVFQPGSVQLPRRGGRDHIPGPREQPQSRIPTEHLVRAHEQRPTRDRQVPTHSDRHRLTPLLIYRDQAGTSKPRRGLKARRSRPSRWTW